MDAWDRLAQNLGRPYCAPAWMFEWWRHMAPPDGDLRTVVVLDRDDLVGIAPYFVQRGRHGRIDYRLLASGAAHRVSPLARRGELHLVARLTAEMLAGAQPRADIVTFEGIDEQSDWPQALRDAWPARPKPRRYQTARHPAPVLDLNCGGYDVWLAGKSSNFRWQMRSAAKRLAAEGASLRLSTRETVDRDLTSLVRLHHARWAARGGSQALTGGMEKLLRAASHPLVDRKRFRLWVLERNGAAISAQLFLAAGGEVAFWGGGFDAAWNRYRPALYTILGAIEDAYTRGDSRMDFGGGAQSYKSRFADGDDPVVWTGLMPLTTRYPMTRSGLLGAEARWLIRSAARRLPRSTRERVRRAVSDG